MAKRYSRKALHGRRNQRGVALFIGMVFLIILTLTALIAMRGTLLEMHMTSATAQHEQAFQASEVAREIPEALLASYAYYHGWPVTWGGTVPDAQYALETLFQYRPLWASLLAPSKTGGGLQNSCGGGLENFILDATIPCSGRTASYNYTPSQWATTFVINTCTNGLSTCTYSQQAVSNVAIVRDGVIPATGSGAAAQQGYASLGVGTAKGGALLLLQVRADTKVPNGEAVTVAQYRLNIVN